jgi:type II secretion system protein G
MIYFRVRARSAFTLIELLIVVAIIGILAAIAIPNFLEAQVRGKVARVQSDMRHTAMALEVYYVDNDAYPPCGLPGATELIMPPLARLKFLTTPIAYLSNVAEDPFKEYGIVKKPTCKIWQLSYRYREERGFIAVKGMWPLGPVIRWELNSFGPDKDCDGGAIVIQYDATNGTTSNGDISRWGP